MLTLVDIITVIELWQSKLYKLNSHHNSVEGKNIYCDIPQF